MVEVPGFELATVTEEGDFSSNMPHDAWAVSVEGTEGPTATNWN